MITSAALYRLSWLLNITLDIRNICVFLAPLFSSLTTIITYLLTKELKVHLKLFLLLWVHKCYYFSLKEYSIKLIYSFSGFCIRPICSCNDRYCAWLHISISCRIIWQWRHSNLLHVVYILHVDQSCENWSYMLGYMFRTGIFLHGVLVGRIRFFDKFNTITCVYLDGDWLVFTQDIHCI